MNDPINKPSHYTSHPSGVECIEITEHLPFNAGNAVKYLWRAFYKGSPLQDIAKAAWYLRREADRVEAGGKWTGCRCARGAAKRVMHGELSGSVLYALMWHVKAYQTPKAAKLRALANQLEES